MPKQYSYLFLVVSLIVIDQVAKYLANIHGQIFRNYLFAFSAPVPAPLMYSIYAIILVVIVWYVVTRYSRFGSREKLAWTLVAAGAVSNIGERVINGYVKDFIYLFSGVFNFADFYILFGVVLLLLVRDRHIKPENT